jgi:hypothetical protein
MRIYDILRTVDPSFPAATAFIADQIAEKIDGHEAEDFTNWPPEAYGNIAPPYGAFFVEARTKTSNAEVAEQLVPKIVKQTPGYRGAKFTDLADEMIVDRALFFQDVTTQPRIKAQEYLFGDPQPFGTCWVLAVFGFMRVDTSDLTLFPGHAYLHIGAAGQLLDDTARLHMVEYPPEMLIPGVDYNPLVQLATFIPFGLFAIKALHDRCEVELVKPSRQVRRAMERKEGITPQLHYILKINTPTPQKRYVKPAELKPEQTEKPGVRRHDVRGHFHFYTKEKPLFGRIAGAVWIPPHKRGKEAAGEVKKDYLISPAKPKDEAAT